MTILTRRRILQTSVAALALTSVPCLALAHSHSDQLLADILIGVGDALQREWIRDNYGHGHWDGHYWNYGGHRYTPLEYRDFWLSRYQPPAPPPPPPPRPAAPPPPPPRRPGPPPHHPEPGPHHGARPGGWGPGGPGPGPGPR